MDDLKIVLEILDVLVKIKSLLEDTFAIRRRLVHVGVPHHLLQEWMVSGRGSATHELRHHTIKCLVYGLEFIKQRALLQRDITELLNIVLIGLFDLA